MYKNLGFVSWRSSLFTIILFIFFFNSAKTIGNLFCDSKIKIINDEYAFGMEMEGNH